MAVTLVVLALAVVVATALASASVFQLSLASMQSNQTSARHAAESVAAAALQTVMADASMKWGQPGTGDTIHCHFGTAVAGLTFDAAVATQTGLVQSVNNFQQPSLRAPDLPGETIPANSVWVAGVGSCENSRAVCIQVLTFPRFPYPVAANSAVHSAGGLLVGSAPPGMSAAEMALDPTRLLAATIDSNQNSAVALSLGIGSYVSGDARACGGVQLGANSRVAGSLLPNSAAVTLPTIDVTQFDPSVSQSGVLTPGGNSLSGYNRVTGDYNVDGDLTLSNGVLYVDGNMTVNGGLHGTGAIFVTGTTQINGPTQIATTDQMALVSRGDIALVSTPGQGAYFRGLVYTQGALHSSHIVMDGTFIANNAASSSVQMDQTTVLYEPQLSSVAFQIWSSGSGGAGSGLWFNSSNTPQLSNFSYQFNFGLPFKANNDPSNLIQNGAVIPDSQLLQIMAANAELDIPSPQWCQQLQTPSCPLWQPMVAQLASLPWTSAWLADKTSIHATSASQLTASNVRLVSIGFDDTAAEEQWVAANYPGESLDHIHQLMNLALQDALAKAKTQLQAYINHPALLQPQPPSWQNYVVDLNEFISPADRARLALWKQL